MSFYSLDNRRLRIRPTLDQSRILGISKPTYVVQGIYGGYSMPIFNDDNEELLYRTVLPARWDGVTPIEAKVYCYLSGNEDVGDKFKIQFLYDTTNCDSESINTSGYLSTSTETTIVEGRNTQYSAYCVHITIPHATAVADDYAVGCIRRIAASASEVTNEIVVMYIELIVEVDKIFGVV